MKDGLPQTIYLKDYKVSAFLVDSTDLVFELGDTQTKVTTSLAVRRNSASDDQTGAFELNRKGDVELQWIEVDGRRLEQAEYSLTDDLLSVHNLPASCQVKPRC